MVTLQMFFQLILLFSCIGSAQELFAGKKSTGRSEKQEQANKRAQSVSSKPKNIQYGDWRVERELGKGKKSIKLTFSREEIINPDDFEESTDVEAAPIEREKVESSVLETPSFAAGDKIIIPSSTNNNHPLIGEVQFFNADHTIMSTKVHFPGNERYGSYETTMPIFASDVASYHATAKAWLDKVSKLSTIQEVEKCIVGKHVAIEVDSSSKRNKQSSEFIYAQITELFANEDTAIIAKIVKLSTKNEYYTAAINDLCIVDPLE